MILKKKLIRKEFCLKLKFIKIVKWILQKSSSTQTIKGLESRRKQSAFPTSDDIQTDGRFFRLESKQDDTVCDNAPCQSELEIVFAKRKYSKADVFRLSPYSHILKPTELARNSWKKEIQVE